MAQPAAKASPVPAKASFEWEDPLLLEDLLTEDERMVRDTGAAIALDRGSE